jgi:hypothetical protein
MSTKKYPKLLIHTRRYQIAGRHSLNEFGKTNKQKNERKKPILADEDGLLHYDYIFVATDQIAGRHSLDEFGTI